MSRWSLLLLWSTYWQRTFKGKEIGGSRLFLQRKNKRAPGGQKYVPIDQDKARAMACANLRLS